MCIVLSYFYFFSMDFLSEINVDDDDDDDDDDEAAACITRAS